MLCVDVYPVHHKKGNVHIIIKWFIPVVIWLVNPITPVSDQDTISPYNINTISSWQATRIKKNIN